MSVENEPQNTEAYPPVGTDSRRDLLIGQLIPVREMTDREIAEETLVIMREVQKLVTSFLTEMGNGKMGQMMGMFGAMMGGRR